MCGRTPSQSTATFEVIYDYSQFVKNSVCKAAATPTSLGYQEDYDHNKFAVSLDTRTAAMASAVSGSSQLLTQCDVSVWCVIVMVCVFYRSIAVSSMSIP